MRQCYTHIFVVGAQLWTEYGRSDAPSACERAHKGNHSPGSCSGAWPLGEPVVASLTAIAHKFYIPPTALLPFLITLLVPLCPLVFLLSPPAPNPLTDMSAASLPMCETAREKAPHMLQLHAQLAHARRACQTTAGSLPAQPTLRPTMRQLVFPCGRHASCTGCSISTG